MERLARKEDEFKIGWIKRFMEYESLIPGFHEEEIADTEGTLKKYGFPISVEDVSFYPSDPEDPYTMKPVYEDSAAPIYAAFMKSKISNRNVIKELSNPQNNESMRKWHERQRNRCSFELGPRNDAFVHVPLTIELADGCSMGCKFCGLGAGKLKSVFRYTEENARMFRKVLRGAKDIIGIGAGQGTLYFATEPLDNPDYELFNKDYEEIFERIPQITTAAVMRHKDRMHELLKPINKNGTTIYRFSCLSEDIVRQVFQEFTPEELVYTELLPQFPEAPGSVFVNAGRQGDETGELDSTISCVSGFVINFARQTVKLTTPVNASPEHPTGEYIYEETHFEDADGCIELMKSMISKYMQNIIGPKERLKLRDNVSIGMEDGKLVVDSELGMRLSLGSSEEGVGLYKDILELFAEGYHTKREVVTHIVNSRYEGKMLRTELLYYGISKLWGYGILQTESGVI